MKSTASLAAVSLCLISSYATAITYPPITKTFNYEDGTGSWTKWVNSTDAAVTTQGVVADNTTGPSGNHAYQITVTLPPAPTTNSVSYLYFYLPNEMALYGSLNLTGNFKVEVIAGDGSKAEVRLGTNLYNEAFGIYGNAPSAFGISIDGQWHGVGGDVMPSIAQNIQNTLVRFAQSQADDYIPYTQGPTLYVKNLSTTSQLQLRISIDDVALNGAVAANYKAEAAAAAQNYVNRITNQAVPSLTSLHQDIVSTKNAIDNLSLNNQSALYNKITTNASSVATSHSGIVSSYQTRTPLAVPTQAQYDQDIANLNTLNSLLSIGNYVATSGQSFLYYPWESTGKARFDEFALGMPSTPQQVIQATLALNEIEPISIALQNLFDQTIIINQVNLGNISNQFGDILDSSQVDARIVKSWYVGSTSHIYVSSSDTKVRAPELLLKDDALVKADDSTKTNFLRINTQNTSLYQDVSTTTAQMPNDAVTQDATTLQPFTIGVLQARQLWLALDTRANVKPGQYSGNIDLSYTFEGQSSTQTLQIPISFFVQPLQLQESSFTYSIYYLGKIGNGTPRLSDPKSGQKKSQTQYLAEIKNIYDHGIPYPTQYIDSVDDINNYVTLRTQLGLPCDRYYLLGGPAMVGTSTASASANASALTNALTSSSNCTNPQLYMYGADEGTPEQIQQQHDAMQIVHSAGAKTFVAAYKDDLNPLLDVLDTLIYGKTVNDSEINTWRQAGRDVFAYNNPQVGIPDPSIYRSRYGLYLWQHNFTGAMDYAYQDGQPAWSQRLCNDTATSYCSMWNNFDNAAYYNLVFAYPTTNGVIDTIQWEGFREAVDDTRYLATLQTLIQSSSNSALVTEINNWLATIKTQSDLDPIATRKTMQNYFKLLNVAPSLSNVSTNINGTTISISGQASDPEGYLAAVEVKLDGGAWINLGKTNSWQNNFTNVGYGNHTVYYRVTDYWGTVANAQSTAIIQSPQTITVNTAAPFSATYGNSFTVAATASSGLDVAISTAGGCSNIGNVITMTSGSTPCTVKYDQSGNANYLSTPQVTSSTGASKASQTITVSQAAPTNAGYGSTFAVGASASSNLPVGITVSGGCSVSVNSVTMTSASTACKVNYNQAGNANYSAASQVSSTTTAKKGTQTISSNQPATFTRNTNMTVTATSASGLTVTIAKSSGSCTKVNGGSGSIVMKMGALNSTCVLKYTQSGNTNYNAATNNNTTISTTAK